MILFLLLFLSSGFVQTQTMPGGLRQFASTSPHPVADTCADWLTGAAIGDHAIAAIAWSNGHLCRRLPLAIRLYNRRPSSRAKVSGTIQHHG